MNVVMMGPPGSGKGTMSERVAVRCGMAHISTGDMLREQIKKGTELGNLAKGYIDKGALVPDDVIIGMVKARMEEDDAKKGVLLDGFPRTLAQAKELDAIVTIDKCINLEVGVDVIIERVECRRVCNVCGAVHSTKTCSGNTCEKCDGQLVQRPDDTEATVRERFRVYEEQTAPLIGYYREKGIVESVDGTLPIEEEAGIICKLLGEE